MFFKLDCKVNGKCVLVNGIYRDGCFIKWCYWCRNGNVYSFGSEIVEFGKFLKIYYKDIDLKYVYKFVKNVFG